LKTILTKTGKLSLSVWNYTIVITGFKIRSFCESWESWQTVVSDYENSYINNKEKKKKIYNAHTVKHEA